MKARDLWSYIQPWDVDSIPVDILDEEARRGWMRAMFVAGGQCMDWRGIELFWGRKPEGQP